MAMPSDPGGSGGHTPTQFAFNFDEKNPQQQLRLPSRIDDTRRQVSEKIQTYIGVTLCISLVAANLPLLSLGFG